MMKLFLHVDNDYLALISFISDFLQDRFWSLICTFAGCRHGRNRKKLGRFRQKADP